MFTYACDWCQRTKTEAGNWMVGLAAEHRGAVTRRREVSILKAWSERWARHPLAVHFCSQEHKDLYVNALFTGRQRRQAALVTASFRSGSARRRPKSAGSSQGFDADDVLRAHSLGVLLD